MTWLGDIREHNLNISSPYPTSLLFINSSFVPETLLSLNLLYERLSAESLFQIATQHACSRDASSGGDVSLPTRSSRSITQAGGTTGSAGEWGGPLEASGLT
jgi:hypothetical protein